MQRPQIGHVCPHADPLGFCDPNSDGKSEDAGTAVAAYSTACDISSHDHPRPALKQKKAQQQSPTQLRDQPSVERYQGNQFFSWKDQTFPYFPWCLFINFSRQKDTQGPRQRQPIQHLTTEHRDPPSAQRALQRMSHGLSAWWSSSPSAPRRHGTITVPEQRIDGVPGVAGGMANDGSIKGWLVSQINGG